MNAMPRPTEYATPSGIRVKRKRTRGTGKKRRRPGRRDTA
jgi:hypothetical protein